MNEDLELQDELSDRLRALGQRPIEPALQSHHLTAIASVEPATALRGLLASRLKLGAALLGGILIGATGLTTAGALGPLQPIAATAVEAVTPVAVPGGPTEKAKEAKEAKEKAKAEAAVVRYFGSECNVLGVTAARNHGLYIKALREAGATKEQLKTAATSDCGKPVARIGGTDDESGKPEATVPAPDATAKGKSADAPGQQNKSAGSNNGKANEEHGQAGVDHGKATASDKSGVDAPPPSKPVTPTPAEGQSKGSDHANAGSETKPPAGPPQDG